MRTNQRTRNVTGTRTAAAAGRSSSSGESWATRVALGSAVLAVFVVLIGLVARRAIDGGWFAAVDAFAIDASPDHPLTRFFAALTWLGTPPGVTGASLLALFAFLRRREFRDAGTLLCSVLTAAFANDALKTWVARERPEHAGIVEAPGYSFLSGHAFVGTAMYGLLALTLLEHLDRPAHRVALGTFSVLFIALMGFSRIYLGVHYTSDVIAGILLGIVWIVVWKRVFRPGAERLGRR